jgi:hypothetical protein
MGTGDGSIALAVGGVASLASTWGVSFMNVAGRTLILAEARDKVCGGIGDEAVGEVRVAKIGVSLVLDAGGTFAAGVEGAVAPEGTALVALRDGAALLADIVQRAVVVQAVCGAVATDAVGTGVSASRGHGYQANLYLPP